MGLLETRSLPLWRARDDAAARVAATLDELTGALRETAQALCAAAKAAALTGPRKSPAIAAQLQDALFASQDNSLNETAQRLFNLYADSGDVDDANDRAREVSGAFVKDAGDNAFVLFDATFPVRNVDTSAIRVARARADLGRKLTAICNRKSPT